MKQIFILFVQVTALCILASSDLWAAADEEGPMAKVSHDLAILYHEYESYQVQGTLPHPVSLELVLLNHTAPLW
jgi:hypothetical protein